MGPQAAFPYRDRTMFVEDVELPALAAAVGTPFYCYSLAALERRFEEFQSAFSQTPSLICYAMKANSNQAVLRVFAKMGAGVDVVSGGELQRALAAGIPGERITFSGVGKSAAELAQGLDARILCFNVESEPELRLLSQIAVERGAIAPIALRVNPDVDAQTHAKISTGLSDSKFGVPLARARTVYREAALLPGLRIVGVDMHIGSQITRPEPFEAAFGVLAQLVGELRADGRAIEHVDLGGGLGVAYHWSDEPAFGPQQYAALARRHFDPLAVKLLLEPGRFLVANAGALITRVLYVKEGEGKSFVVVDAAMNDLVRPTLYEAHHEIAPVRRPLAGASERRVDVVGPVCESGDFLALDRAMTPVEPGDLLAVLSAGAYGAVQSGTYNSRRLIAEVLVSDDKWALVRRRPTYAELIGLDSTPDWLR